MPHWLLKAVVQGGLSLLPQSQSWNYFFQKYITKSLDLEDMFEHKLVQCRKHMENYLITTLKRKTLFSVLELGTGWHPIVPVGLYLCGASKIWTIDRTSLLRFTGVREVLGLFVEYAENGNLSTYLPWIHKSRIFELQNVLEENSLSSASQILEKINIYPVVCDARNTGLESSMIDLLVSNNTLEHIPEDVLLSIFSEFRRVSSPEAIMSHSVDMGDHYAIFDHSITPYNFLKYSSFLWRLFNNSLQYQNRLRISDYRRIHEAAGFKIIYEHNKKGSCEDFDSVHLVKEFQHYSREELLVINSWIVSTCNNEPNSR